MRHVLVVWTNVPDPEVELRLSLALLGLRNRKLGAMSSWDVVFLEGFQLLSLRYRELLSRLGYTLHDAEKTYLKLARDYDELARFGDYEMKCFIRWLVMQELFGDAPLVHYDADIVFNVNPDEIDEAFGDLTFVLQGCPAFTRLNDPNWFVVYRRHLERLAANCDKYSADAWSRLDSYREVAKNRNSTLWHRKTISSDQDLLRFLTLSSQIPQADSAAVAKHNPFALFENPLEIGREIDQALPLCYKRKDGVDYVGNRRVAFWHFQSDFCDYLGYALFLRERGNAGRVPWVRGLWPESYEAYRQERGSVSAFLRGQLIRRFIDVSADFSIVFTKDIFWDERVFV